MAVELGSPQDNYSDGRLPANDTWTKWINSQNHHFDRTPKTIYWCDIPVTIFVGFCLTQIFKNL